MDDKIVLRYDLFAGDFGDQNTKTLENKIVTTKKTHIKACHICIGDIQKGEKSRVQKDVFEGNLESYRICEKCCEAISYDYENNCELKIDERYKIGDNIRKYNSNKD